MPKERLLLAAAYQKYFYKDGVHLTGAALVEAYKELITDAFSGEFSLVDDDGEEILPGEGKTPKDLRDYQHRLDDRIYDYVKNGLSGKERSDALASDVLGCVAPEYQKLNCAKFNVRELAESTEKSRTPAQNIMLRLALVFGEEEPEKTLTGKADFAEKVSPIAAEIRSHKPWFITRIFRPAYYRERKAEYESMKTYLEGAVTAKIYPHDIEQHFGGRAFRGFSFGERATMSKPDALYTGLMQLASDMVGDAEYRSVYYPAEAEQFKARYQGNDQPQKDEAFTERIGVAVQDQPVEEEELQNAPVQNAELLRTGEREQRNEEPRVIEGEEQRGLV